MTRFARAKGSKSSNERLPEKATSWKAMKEGLEQSTKEAELNKQREKINEIRQRKYDDFVQEVESKVEKTWAEFPGVKKTPQKKSPMKKNKSPAKLITENDVTDEMIEEFIQPNAEIDSKIDDLQSQIELILQKKRRRDNSNSAAEEPTTKISAKQATNKKQNKKKQQLAKNINTEDDSDVDDAPGEQLTKQATNKKQNKKKQKLANSIKTDNSDVDDASEEQSTKQATIKKQNKKKQKLAKSIKSVDDSDVDDAPEDQSTKQATNKKQNKKKQKLANSIKTDNSDVDDASEGQSTKQATNKKQNKNKQKLAKSIKTDDDSDEDDAPEEQSSKIPPKQIVNKKKQKIEEVNIEDISIIEKSKVQNNKNNGKNKKQNNQNNNMDNKNQKGPNQKNENGQNANKHLNQQSKKTANGPSNKNNQNGSNQFTDDKTQGQKHKIAKVRDNEVHKRRKLIEEDKLSLVVDGVEEKLTYFQGFPIRKSEADRLTALRKTMISKGVPKSEVERSLKNERRKAEKRIARLRKNICFQCRKAGHLLSDCPELLNGTQAIETAGSGICYKCGSTEHSHLQCRGKEGYKFATCFICREQGHISRECPDNPRGLYPDGGACKLCGDVTHLKKDCPISKQEQLSNEVVVDTISKLNGIDSLENAPSKTHKPIPKKQIVKF